MPENGGAGTIIGAAVVTTEFRKTPRLEYGLWRYVQVALAIVGMICALAHVIGAGRLSQTPVGVALWASLTLFSAGVVIWLRVVKPMRLGRGPYPGPDHCRTAAPSAAPFSGGPVSMVVSG